MSYKEIRTFPKLGLSQTPDLESFATASRWRCQQNRRRRRRRRRSSLLTNRGCLLQVSQL